MLYTTLDYYHLNQDRTQTLSVLQPPTVMQLQAKIKVNSENCLNLQCSYLLSIFHIVSVTTDNKT